MSVTGSSRASGAFWSAMNDLNLRPGSKHLKCAKIAGNTSGNYHPHGEAIIYPTLVRMAQDWNLRYPLIDGRETSAAPTAIRPPPCDTPKPAWPDRRRNLMADLESRHRRLPAQLRRAFDGADGSARPSSPICWSTAQRASPSAWRAICCRTTCAKSATPSSM